MPWQTLETQPHNPGTRDFKYLPKKALTYSVKHHRMHAHSPKTFSDSGNHFVTTLPRFRLLTCMLTWKLTRERDRQKQKRYQGSLLGSRCSIASIKVSKTPTSKSLSTAAACLRKLGLQSGVGGLAFSSGLGFRIEEEGFRCWLGLWDDLGFRTAQFRGLQGVQYVFPGFHVIWRVITSLSRWGLGHFG